MKKILVIDDDVAITEAIQMTLESENYHVKALTNIDQITTTITTYNPDVILLDLLIAGAKQNGKELALELKKSPKTKHIPIVMLSAHPLAEKSAQESSADGFIAKPFDIDVLLSEVEKFVKKN